MLKMGSIGTKLYGDSCSEDAVPSDLNGLNRVISENEGSNLRDLTSKVQHLTFLVAGGELPIRSDHKLWKDIADLSESLIKLRQLYPEELRIKSKSILSLLESVCSANQQTSSTQKVSVSVQCDDGLFANGLDHFCSVVSDDSTRGSSDSLVGDATVNSRETKSASKTPDIVYICSECNGTIPVFNNDAFSLSLKLHYESAAHSQDSGQRNDKDDCRTTSPISTDSTSTTPSDVSVTSGETTEDDYLHTPSETKTAVNVCIVKPSHAENSVRLTRCGTNSDATPRHISMWNSVRSRLVELGHVNYIVHHPHLKDFRCSLCKTSITGVQNIMQHILGSTHTKLHLEERAGDKCLHKDDSDQMTGNSSDDSSTNGKLTQFEQDLQQSDSDTFESKQGLVFMQSENSDLMSSQILHITPKLNSDGSVNYKAWQSMAQDIRNRGLDACIQIFVCSVCGTQLTGIQKFIEHVHSYGHKDKNPSYKKPERVISRDVIPISNGGFSSSSSIEEISTPQFKCTPCNLTLTEKDVLAHLAGKKHALKESLMRISSKEDVGRDSSYCDSKFERSKLGQKVVNGKRSTLREPNGKFHAGENSTLALNNLVKAVEAIPKCDEAAQTISISNAVNSSEKTLGVASKKELEERRKLYSKQDDVCRTGFNMYRYSSRHYSGMHSRKNKMSAMSCNYEALKRPAGYWCGVCNIMVSENQKYFHIHGDVELPCIPQQQVFGSAQYLIMNHSQSWGQ